MAASREARLGLEGEVGEGGRFREAGNVRETEPSGFGGTGVVGADKFDGVTTGVLVAEVGVAAADPAVLLNREGRVADFWFRSIKA